MQMRRYSKEPQSQSTLITNYFTEKKNKKFDREKETLCIENKNISKEFSNSSSFLKDNFVFNPNQLGSSSFQLQSKNKKFKNRKNLENCEKIPNNNFDLTYPYSFDEKIPFIHKQKKNQLMDDLNFFHFLNEDEDEKKNDEKKRFCFKKLESKKKTKNLINSYKEIVNPIYTEFQKNNILKGMQILQDTDLSDPKIRIAIKKNDFSCFVNSDSLFSENPIKVFLHLKKKLCQNLLLKKFYVNKLNALNN